MPWPLTTGLPGSRKGILYHVTEESEAQRVDVTWLRSQPALEPRYNSWATFFPGDTGAVRGTQPRARGLEVRQVLPGRQAGRPGSQGSRHKRILRDHGIAGASGRRHALPPASQLRNSGQQFASPDLSTSSSHNPLRQPWSLQNSLLS